jgi:hypothetical protein
MPANIRKMLMAVAMISAAPPAFADVITDWDEKAVAIVNAMPPYNSERIMGMVHAAMFDAVNSIERRYRPYLVQLPVPRARRRKLPPLRQPPSCWRRLTKRQPAR